MQYKSYEDAIGTFDLTLTESTGMLIDAALENAKRAAKEREALREGAAREELRRMRERVWQERVRAAKRRRRVQAGAVVAVWSLALGAGGLVFGQIGVVFVGECVSDDRPAFGHRPGMFQYLLFRIARVNTIHQKAFSFTDSGQHLGDKISIIPIIII